MGTPIVYYKLVFSLKFYVQMSITDRIFGQFLGLLRPMYVVCYNNVLFYVWTSSYFIQKYFDLGLKICFGSYGTSVDFFISNKLFKMYSRFIILKI